jgi:cytochrome c oxidase cbb3-type subunit 3
MSQKEYNDESKYDVGHVYDDIHELNHPAPKWWQWIFYLSIVWGIGYYAYYEWMGGPTLDQELNTRLEEIASAQKSNKKAGPSDDELNALSKDSGALSKGKAVYVAKCASCHGNEGQGIIGPNLVDKFWIHGDGKLASVLKTVQEGVLDKGMPPWASVLSEEEQNTVVAYVGSLQGTNPPNPKAPQGTEIK